jgi:hypothetical protein
MEEARRNWLRPSGLFGKYVVAFVGLVVFVLAVNVALETWSMYRETTVTVAGAESEKTEATAHRVASASYMSATRSRSCAVRSQLILKRRA